MILKYKGIKINYNKVGHGKSIVFLHGFLENSTMWQDCITFFSKRYQCIAIDLLGHGHTECLGYIHTMEDMANAVKAVLTHLGVSNATWVGHSMGGYVALAAIDLFPDLVGGLVLVNATSYPDSEERKINRSRAIDFVKKNPKAYISMAITNLFAEKNRAKVQNEIMHIKNQASQTSLQGILSALEGMKNRKDRSKVLNAFKGPKAIFSGKKDPVIAYQKSIQESEQLSTNLISFDAGHMIHVENTENFLSELEKFLA
ncbi:alpha/beta hydrolase [Aquimarina sp. U1-2]|uniref:alpha/beta fold hydrolase n=1 Tax=Aquimarina sp. U1-2 TaxID=2823141 RepID=UPI001AECAD3E|nr:alpha/beta hydrolase [Aquimarina sp. U1-2]MBP2831148.1 alpha/beta hydrolase [Aquimarina sp. U1-2]